ncbi:hypothetical protein, partial [Oscillibacter sp.]|uniref:hypothetical protein n=1 Tax=Oscillibacter sp. TaxID=1945593 RepID=UPI0033959578
AEGTKETNQATKAPAAFAAGAFFLTGADYPLAEPEYQAGNAAAYKSGVKAPLCSTTKGSFYAKYYV